MFLTNSMLLWWTLDGVPLPLVIKKGSSAMEIGAQVQSYISQTQLTSELNFPCSYFTLVKALSIEEQQIWRKLLTFTSTDYLSN